MEDFRQKAIQIIEGTIDTAQMFARGEVPLEKLNAGLRSEECYASFEDVAEPILLTVSHYIEFSVQLGLLDREKDEELLERFTRRMNLVQ